MRRNTPDYDNVFKTMKSKHKRLFIPVINDVFGKRYPPDTEITVLPSEGYLTEDETADGSKKIEERISDFLLRIGDDTYLLECQSYQDDSMAIRIAEYAFIAARQSAVWDIGHASVPMPAFSIIYIKGTDRTPEKTSITFTFPDGQRVVYEAGNVILERFAKETIVEKRLFPYIPYYIARYDQDISQEKDVSHVTGDLAYFRDELLQLRKEGELSDGEMIDLMRFVNTIIKHITNGNKNEERLVKVMGGTIIETESEKWLRQGVQQGIQQGVQQGEAKMLIELGQEDGLDDEAILQNIQKRIGLSPEEAKACLEKYGKRLA